MKAIAEALSVSRSNLMAAPKPRLPLRIDVEDDVGILAGLKSIATNRSTYGYRRTCAILNRLRRREGSRPVNHKRAYRLMRDAGLLLQRHTGKSTHTHEGKIITMKSDLRYCTDGFEIRCWNGERVQVIFSLDCCDREVIAFKATGGYPTALTVQDLMADTVEARFGSGMNKVPHPIEWLSDNGPIYTAHAARDFGRALGFIVCNTPSYSPESNGMAEAFVKTFKRDYAYVNELKTAPHVLAQLPAWFADYNEVAPHKGLKMKSPREFRIEMSHP